MNRKEFGKLIASLRRDMGWTQSQLAGMADIDEPIISQIERGVKRHFDSGQLVALAGAFQMITLERQEFFLASTGVEPSEMVRPNLPQVSSDTDNPEKELEKIQRLMEQIRVPAFVRDPYSDIIMANGPMAALYGMNPSNLEMDLNTSGMTFNSPHSFNIIHYLFFQSQPIRAHVNRDQDWDSYFLNALRTFRISTLRYRAKPYFNYLMQIFQNPVLYPSFERYWKLTYSMEQDSEANTYIVSYPSRNLGDMTFMSTSTQFITAFGELYLVQSQPLNENTERIFSRLANTYENAVYRYASWPEKRIPITR
jgi:transcriptional regulator with XRE-family HTH domain